MELKYGHDESELTHAGRFQGIIRRAYEMTGKQVVFLVDEYDAPLLDSNSFWTAIPILNSRVN